jgi:hypothetical protein
MEMVMKTSMMSDNEMHLRRQLLRAVTALEVLHAYIPERAEAIENLALIKELRMSIGTSLLVKASTK